MPALRAQMTRTYLRIEKHDDEPLELEVNGKRLTGPVERGAFYAAGILLALGTLWVTVAVVLPLLGVLLSILFSLVGIGIIVVAIVVIGVLLWVVVSTLLERTSPRRRGRDGWEE